MELIMLTLDWNVKLETNLSSNGTAEFCGIDDYVKQRLEENWWKSINTSKYFHEKENIHEYKLTVHNILDTTLHFGSTWWHSVISEGAL